jgi:lipopolysaccharide/colanic/teichoic acid biosynthesis glycosyltransferase
VLVVSDIAVFLVLRGATRALRASGAEPELVFTLFPPGFLGGWQFLAALLISLAIAGTYGAGDRRREGSRVLSAAGLAALLALYASVWTDPVGLVLVRGAIVTAVFGTSLALSRQLVDAIVWRLRPHIGVSRAIVIAHADADWQDLAGLLERTRDFVVVRTIGLGRHTGRGIHSALHNLPGEIEQSDAETVLLWGNLSDAEFNYAVDVAAIGGCRLLAGARNSIGEIEPRGVWVGGRQLVELTPPMLRGWQVVMKRAVDLAGATFGLVILSPILVGLALAVKLDSRGPVFFMQDRLGARARRFRCLKFRSMRQDAEAVLRSSPALYERYLTNDFKLPEGEDPRVTRIGRFLRRTSLDELPQLLNVLKGDMSLVGPRPIVPGELEHYGAGAQLFLSLKPGMTGQWAVSGRTHVVYPERARMELEYIRKWSLLSDIGILLRTIPAVLAKRGAH